MAAQNTYRICETLENKLLSYLNIILWYIYSSSLSHKTWTYEAILGYVKALDTGECFKYICYAFSGLSEEKKRAGNFNGPQIRLLLKDVNFMSSITSVEARTLDAFCAVIRKFLGKNKVENFIELLQELLSSFEAIGCNMSIKLHYFKSHPD